jgi:hypothetical protein
VVKSYIGINFEFLIYFQISIIFSTKCFKRLQHQLQKSPYRLHIHVRTQYSRILPISCSYAGSKEHHLNCIMIFFRLRVKTYGGIKPGCSGHNSSVHMITGEDSFQFLINTCENTVL